MSSATQSLSPYIRLVRLDKPVGIWLLLWPTLWGLWVAAGGLPPPGVALIFVLGTVLMRSAGCAINDWADRDFDGHVARTRSRPLASGELPARAALWVAAGLALLAFLLILPLPPAVWLWSVPALLLAGSYPFTKRFLAIPQAYLGLAFGFGIPMAFVAVTGDVPAVAWLLLAANVAWTLAYDTEYAMVDRADDLKLGIRTSAITFGRFDVAVIALCYFANLLLLAVAGGLLGRGVWWMAGLVIACGIAVYHLRLIAGRDPAACFRAFRHNVWYGAAVFAGIAADYALMPAR
ncbi:MAG: 4-hydroxybenzoate octaprenyltransferase [Rhodocyclaceae bacterium]|nr:4-hydroxybenzoate octaprenyltransferase [Rhodocyclaceae bacterium]